MTDKQYGDLAGEFDAPAIIAAYEKGRPRYLPATIDVILEEHAAGPTDRLTVVDAGTGTGLLTASIVEAGMPSIAHIHAFDRPKMAAAARASATLQPAIESNQISITEANFAATGLPDRSVHLYLAAQALHWGTRNPDDFTATLRETTRVIKDGGSVFAVYNTPVAVTSDSFTWDLNDLLAQKCPDPYYQAMTSGSVGAFLQNARSNLGRFFFDLIQLLGGRIVFREIDNPTYYPDLDTIRSYVFSNAFVANAVKMAAERGSDLRAELQGALQNLVEKHQDDAGQVIYGNKTWIVGIVGLERS